MTNVFKFDGETQSELNVDEMLEANKGVFETLVFAGRDKDGKFHAGSSIGDVGEMLVLIELFKAELMQGVE